MKQKGSVLLMTLVFIALTAMLCMSLLENGLLARQLLFQQQQKARALLMAENALHQLLMENQVQLSQAKTAGFRYCAAIVDSECDDYGLTLSIILNESEKLHFSATAQAESSFNRQAWEVHIQLQAGVVVEIYAGVEFFQPEAAELSQYHDAEAQWIFF